MQVLIRGRWDDVFGSILWGTIECLVTVWLQDQHDISILICLCSAKQQPMKSKGMWLHELLCSFIDHVQGSAVWLAGCVSRACLTLDVVSVTVRTARHSSPPPAFQSIRPPPSKRHGAGEPHDTAWVCVRVEDAALWWKIVFPAYEKKIFFVLWLNYTLQLQLRCPEWLTKCQLMCILLPDALTPAWWKIRPTGPTTTVPPPTPGWFYWA